MISTIFNWMAEHIGNNGRNVSIEIFVEDTIPYSDMEYDEISPYDAMACASCQDGSLDNSVPTGKQVF